MADLISRQAEEYAAAHTTQFDGALAAAAQWTQDNSSVPQMMAGVAEARLLEMLIAATAAKRVLEIGTFTGVGALGMAAALAPGGRLTTLEVDPDNAAAARRHFEASPYGDRIELIEGDALQTLAELEGPFDLVWIDAWKADYPAYYDAVFPKLAERGVIVADNLFRGGGAMDASDTDPGMIGIREYARRVQDDDRVNNVLLTIGDGVMVAWRRPG